MHISQIKWLEILSNIPATDPALETFSTSYLKTVYAHRQYAINQIVRDILYDFLLSDIRGENELNIY